MGDINVSIIVPVYNAEKYIKKCLDSILNQTYTEFEIICVNDGSKDNTFTILEEYQKKDNRIKVIHQVNSGPSNARNSGINKAQGKYIAFIDSDDFVDKYFLEEMTGDLIQSDIVICNYIEINNTGEHKVNIFKFLVEKKTENNIEVINEVISGPGGLVWGKLFKTSIIKEKNIRFNENYKMCEDLLFVTEYICNAKKVNKINKNLYIHNKCNENSITANYKSEMFFYQLEIQNEIRNKVGRIKEVENIDAILNRRLKDILMYSIYKEIKNGNSILLKLKNIQKFITCKEVRYEKRNFEKDGFLDKLLVQAINGNKVIRIYLLTLIRSFILNIYNRLNSLRSERANA